MVDLAGKMICWSKCWKLLLPGVRRGNCYYVCSNGIYGDWVNPGLRGISGRRHAGDL